MLAKVRACFMLAKKRACFMLAKVRACFMLAKVRACFMLARVRACFMLARVCIPGSAKTNGRVFNSKLGHIETLGSKCMVCMQPLLKLKTRPKARPVS
jgi:hypothetical protein